MNYCQKLWDKYRELEQAQRDAEKSLRLAETVGGEHIQESEALLSNLEQELIQMQESWDNSFATLEDKRELFGPDYDAIVKLIESSDELDNSLLTDSDRFIISKDRRIQDLHLNGLTSAEGLNLPETIGGNLNLNGLTSTEKDTLRASYPNINII